MIPLINEENQSYYEFVVYAEMKFVLTILIKKRKSEIIAIILKNIETLLIMFLI